MYNELSKQRQRQINEVWIIGVTTQNMHNNVSLYQHIQNMDKTNLQFKEYTLYQKPDGENELTIQGIDKNRQDHFNGIIIL